MTDAEKIAALQSALRKAADELAACAENCRELDAKAMVHRWAREAREAAT